MGKALCCGEQPLLPTPGYHSMSGIVARLVSYFGSKAC
uniref:Uncharacterized protein n=1 Tax=Solanum lycopersicum TaxID=4081 RepID=K4C9H9_SOLLC